MKKAALLLILLFIAPFIHAQWYYTSVMVGVTDVTFVNNTTGFASSGFTIFRTTDGGTTWNYVAGAAMDSIIISLSFPSEKVGYAAGLSGNLLKTADGGDTWTSLTCNTNKDLRCVFFTDENTGYVGGDEHTLLKTTDGGQTWEPLESPQGTAFSIFFTSSACGFLVGNTRGIYKTEDGGVTWQSTEFSTPNKFLSVYFPDPQTGYACGNKDPLNPCMIKTTDGGSTWTEVPVTTGLGLTTVFFLNQDLGYAGGTGGTIIKTTNGGDSWVKQTTPNLGTILSLWFTDSNHGFAGGSALLRTDNGGSPIGIPETSSFLPLQIYPNPSSDVITLTTGTTRSEGDLIIFNSRGEKILEQAEKEFPCQITVASWPSGVYLIRIDTDRGSRIGKLIKD